MKQCSCCKEDKETTEFNKNKTKHDGYQTICKACSRQRSRQYYKDNREKHCADERRRKKKYARELRNIIWQYCLENPCVDCGECDPVVLEFDHKDRSEKVMNVSGMVAMLKPKDTITTEMEKCDIRCANCHRRKTALDLGWYKNLDPKFIENGEDDIAGNDKFQTIKSSKRMHLTVTKEELHGLLHGQDLPFTVIGKMYGVSDNAIRKRCKKLGVEMPQRVRGYFTKKLHQKEKNREL